MVYNLAKTRNRRTRDICDNIFINDKEGKIQTDTTKIIELWKEHYVELLNVTNPRKDLEECEKTYPTSRWKKVEHNSRRLDENWKSLWSGSDADWSLEVVRWWRRRLSPTDKERSTCWRNDSIMEKEWNIATVPEERFCAGMWEL